MGPKITESDSLYHSLEKMSALEIARAMNTEDQKVSLAIQNELEAISKVISCAGETLKTGGRLIYFGAGTSGRLGVLDASECPPTFGVEPDLVIGIIAGGEKALRFAVENAEDNVLQAALDFQQINITKKDLIIGIAASGTTPYVIGGLNYCIENNIKSACITCNPNAPILQLATFPICLQVGPEFLTGSSRLKAGTAQKMTLNMISTGAMILYGRVLGNKMVDMKMTNAKLRQRGIKMLMELNNVSKVEAESLLDQYGSVRNALSHL